MKTLREYIDQLDEISRRDFLKGAGAAAVAGAAGGTISYMNRGINKLDEDGQYRITRLLELYIMSRALTKPSPQWTDTRQPPPPGYHNVPTQEAQEVHNQVKSILERFLQANPNLKDEVNKIYSSLPDGGYYVSTRGVGSPYSMRQYIMSDFDKWYKRSQGKDQPQPEFKESEDLEEASPDAIKRIEELVKYK